MDLKKKMKAFFTLDRHANEGFTLVELIVVIAILAILAGIAVPAYSGYVDKAKMAADQQMLATMNTAFTVACMDKGHYDMTNLPFSPKATGIQTAVQVNSEVNDKFQGYFGDGKFQYFNDGDLTFSKAQGKFVINSIEAIKEALKNAWAGSSFADGGDAVVNELLQTFDGIGDIFTIGAKAGIESFRVGLLGKVSPEIAEALGLTGMFNGLSSAMELSDTDVDKMLTDKGYDPEEYSEEEWADLRHQVRGTAAVMYFANDTAGRNVDDVMASAEALMTSLGTALGTEMWNQKSDFVNDKNLVSEVEKYYLSVATDAEKDTYEKHPDNREQLLWEFYDGVAMSCGSEFTLTGGQLVGLSQNIPATSTEGITSLGAVYALTAGYYNNAASDGREKPGDFGTFGAIHSAMVNKDGTPNTSFTEYCQSDAGKADLQAYLDFMNAVSAGEVDMTDTDAFTGQNSYILGILGATK